MFRRLFVDHPKSVDENYIEHFGVAGRFGAAMIWGGTKALVHAVVPGLCITSGSDTVKRLNHIMVEPTDRELEDWLRSVEKIAKAGGL